MIKKEKPEYIRFFCFEDYFLFDFFLLFFFFALDFFHCVDFVQGFFSKVGGVGFSIASQLKA